MRIAYLNVWDATASETHTGETLKIVARRLGVEIIPCRNNADVEAAAPDFVIVMSRTQAKLTRYPAYICVNEPSTVYFREPKLLHYLYSFDGYLALAETLTRFTRHALHGIGRSDAIGVYYNSAHRQEADSAPVRAALMEGTAKLTYFGTNWDGRRLSFFRMLGQWDGAEIYGPERTWKHLDLPSYKGTAAYDGVSVQEIYRQNGIGLNILGDHHLQEDVISNRVFEITSVGAVCISCRMPWLEKHFGDTLYYIEQESTNASLLEQVKRQTAHILAHPEEAFEKAQKARRIFEEKFSLDIMVGNAIVHHGKRQKNIALQKKKNDPFVSVLIKSNGKTPALLQRALQSVAGQERGRFDVILIQTAPFTPPVVRNVKIKTVPGHSLWDGFPHMKGDYVALLREDHEWFPQHIGRQLDAMRPGVFVHGALVEEHKSAFGETAWIGNNETRSLSQQLDVQEKDPRQALELICPSTILAPINLVDAAMRQPPALERGEEKEFILALLARARPHQSFAATTFLRKGEEIKAPPVTAHDWSLLMLRHWRDPSHTQMPNRLWDQMVDSGVRARASRYETVRTQEDGIVVERLVTCRFDRARLAPMPLPWLKDQSFFRLGLALTDESSMAMTISTAENMQGVAGFIAFPANEDPAIPEEYLLVLEATVEKGQFAVQLLHNQRTLERYNVARAFQAGRTYKLEIPIYYRPEISGLVFEVSPNTVAKVTGLRAYREI